MTTTHDPLANHPDDHKVSFSSTCVRLFGKSCIYMGTLAFAFLGILMLIWFGIALFG